MGAFPIIDGGSNEQKHEFLPKISSGELKVTFALTEPNASFNPSDTEVEAVSEGEDFIVNGTKLFVENAHIADYLICLVRTERGENPETALSLFLIDSNHL
jgi:alkylation response protein AidB-like acyl-CoA dehydrogenase